MRGSESILGALWVCRVAIGEKSNLTVCLSPVSFELRIKHLPEAIEVNGPMLHYSAE
jgi:hypothetical protein